MAPRSHAPPLQPVIGAKVSLDAGPSGGPRPDDGARVGWLTGEMILSGRTVDARRLDRPRVELKLAFRLARPLRGPLVTAAEVLAATGEVLPCLDIVDRDGQTGRLLLGAGTPPPAEGHLQRLRITLRVDGVASATVLPALAGLDWLSERLIESCGTAPPGAILVSQSANASVELCPGTRVAARFGRLGRLELTAPA